MRCKIHAKNILNIGLIIAFLVLILARDVFGVSVNSLAFLIVATLFFILKDNNTTIIISAMVFMIPIYTGIPYVDISIIAMLIILYKNGWRMKINVFTILCLLLIFIIEISSVFASNINFNIPIFLRLIGALLFVFAFIPSFTLSHKLDRVLILKAFLWGMLFMIVTILWQYLREYGLYEFLNLGVRIGNVGLHFDMEAGLRVSNNPNILGITCSAAIYVIVILKEKKVASWWYLLFFPIIVMFGLMTQSRAFVFAFVLIMAYFLITSSKNKGAKSFFVAVFFLIATYYVFTAFFPDYFDNIIARWEVDDITGGRSTIMTAYSQFMRGNPRFIPFGAGLQGHRQQVGGPSSAVHNGFQQVYVSWGIVGVLVVVVLMYSTYKTAAISIKKRDILHIFPLFMYFFSLQTIQWFSNMGMILLNVIWFLTMGLFAIELDEEQTVQDEG
ncbi:MAG: hypothetical protein FWD05_06795 [Oscillospiraceae bacterium]|nr:hypothetical protein [Oscillospiraceae bacterium]